MKIDTSLLVIAAIFWVAYWILRLAFFRPLVRMMDHRDAKVATAQEAFDTATAEAEAAIAGERAKLQEARQAASLRREALRREAEEQRRRLLGEAKAEAHAELEKAAGALADQVAEEQAALDRETRRLADQIASRLLGRAV